ncbi:MAG: heavy metal translocating P-type ATPase metal-binding domain-containing protein [Gammaproteobacteria bacterium]|nr:heavy metal translocating P-type ATPase metal-binding domain-containing protein [Gammaproteobacteria bacterium]
MSQVATQVFGARCFQCEGEIGAGSVAEEIDGQTRRFCSSDCRAAAKQIHDLALGDYYRFRERFTAEPVEPSGTSFSRQRGTPCDDERLLEFAVVDRAIAGGRQVALHIPDIRCAACTWLIESSLAKRDDVARSRIALADRSVTIDYRGHNPLDIVAFVEIVGIYRATGSGCIRSRGAST